MKITLASTSKFKNNIFNTVHLKHSSASPTCEETSTKTNPYEYVEELASKKAESVVKHHSDIIIGLDTIVLINDKIVEKPKSIEEAKNNLKNSSNNTCKVITGISMINKNNNETITTHQETLVTFNYILEEDIEYYIENEPDAMYASGFIVETICSNFIKKIEGSYYNILGIPVEKIYEILNNWDIKLKDLED